MMYGLKSACKRLKPDDAEGLAEVAAGDSAANTAEGAAGEAADTVASAAGEADPGEAEERASRREGKRAGAKLAQVDEPLEANLHTSLRSLAAQGGLSSSVAQRAPKEGRELKSLRQMITQRVRTLAKQKRLALATQMEGRHGQRVHMKP